MAWVLTVIFYRSIKGTEEDGGEYTQLVIEEYADAEEIVVAPPTYTYTDEKTETKDAKPTAAEEAN